MKKIKLYEELIDEMIDLFDRKLEQIKELNYEEQAKELRETLNISRKQFLKIKYQTN